METMDDHREHLAKEQIRNGNLSIAMHNGMGSLFDISWLICNLWGCVKIYQGTFTYGGLAALIQLVGRIQGPIANAVSLVSQTYGVVASAERLQEVIGLPDEEEGTPLKAFDEIRLENVGFQYEESPEDVLKGVNAVIKRGDFVALTGISGGGKTSLFQLLLGIYRPTSGKLLVCCRDRSYPASRGTRKLFSYVPQGNTLFSGTLRSNLLMFAGEASDEEIDAAARCACIGDLIREIGLDAVLGEHGVGLSEGQAQRVAIARALLSKAPILLLDEATSALDARSEALVQQAIESVIGTCTMVIIAHRLNTLRKADRIYRIDEESVHCYDSYEAMERDTNVGGQ
jgi:ABC-type multidrug transport system fused ATPase/permease subunit